MALNGTLSSLVITVAVLWAITKLGRILFSRSPIDNLPGPANHSWLKGAIFLYYVLAGIDYILITGNLSRMYDRQAWDFQDELGEKYGPVSRLSGLLGVGSVASPLGPELLISNNMCSVRSYFCLTPKLFTMSWSRISTSTINQTMLPCKSNFFYLLVSPAHLNHSPGQPLPLLDLL